jgi:hypothetical protein
VGEKLALQWKKSLTFLGLWNTRHFIHTFSTGQKYGESLYRSRLPISFHNSHSLYSYYIDLFKIRSRLAIQRARTDFASGLGGVTIGFQQYQLSHP